MTRTLFTSAPHTSATDTDTRSSDGKLRQGFLLPPAEEVDLDSLSEQIDRLILLSEKVKLIDIYKSNHLLEKIDRLVSIWNAHFITEDIHKLVVKTIRPYLDMEIEAYFSKKPKLLHASRRFVHDSKPLLGHVVQMSRADVLVLFEDNERLVSEFEESLAETGFSFGMHAGDWVPPVKEPYRCR